MNNILNQEQITSIKECGKILAETMRTVEKAVAPGVTTAELDHIAESELAKRGARPSFKNYRVAGVGVYPSSLCTSINDEIVHGLPNKYRTLQEGDIISLDLGAYWHGVHTDMAVTVGVGTIPEKTEKLLYATKSCLETGVKAAVAGVKIGQIGKAIQERAEQFGFGVVRDLVGHGIGPEIHMSPHIPNYGRGNEGPVIVEGMGLAIEPMLTTGSYDIIQEDDGWTISTEDGSLAAHFEYTVVIEGGKAVIVTK